MKFEKEEIAPSETLERLSCIWKAILNVDNVRPHDDFFSLGGDSMRAIRMLVRVSREFEKEVDADRFFGAPTLSTLHALLEPSSPNSGSP